MVAKPVPYKNPSASQFFFLIFFLTHFRRIMPPFAFAVELPAVDDETDRVTRVFALLREKLDAEMKCIPDDKPELMGEKKDWNDRWDALSVRRFIFLFSRF